MKLLKRQYTFFIWLSMFPNNSHLYYLSMFPNNTKKYFSFNNLLDFDSRIRAAVSKKIMLFVFFYVTI